MSDRRVIVADPELLDQPIETPQDLMFALALAVAHVGRLARYMAESENGHGSVALKVDADGDQMAFGLVSQSAAIQSAGERLSSEMSVLARASAARGAE